MATLLRPAPPAPSTLTSVLELLRDRLREGTLTCLNCTANVWTVSVNLLLFRSSSTLLVRPPAILWKHYSAQQQHGGGGSGLKLLYCCSSACGGLHTLCCVWARGEVCRERHSPANKKRGIFIYLFTNSYSYCWNDCSGAFKTRWTVKCMTKLQRKKNPKLSTCINLYIIFIFFPPLHPYLSDIYHKRQSGRINGQQIFLTNRCPASVYSDW